VALRLLSVHSVLSGILFSLRPSIVVLVAQKDSKLIELLSLADGRIFVSLILSNLIEIKLLFALWAKVIQILNNPLPNALLVEDVLAGKHYSVSHIVIADSTGEVVKLL
jgi:hypothetical protein